MHDFISESAYKENLSNSFAQELGLSPSHQTNNNIYNSVEKHTVAIFPENMVKHINIYKVSGKHMQKQQYLNDFLKQIKLLSKISVEKDFTLVEINPLILTEDNQVIALDAKINIDDNALFRNKELKSLVDESEIDSKEISPPSFSKKGLISSNAINTFSSTSFVMIFY